MESSHFRPSVLHVALYKTLFLDFLFRPPNAQNLLPKICTKSPKSACMADRPEMFAPISGFSGMADSMELCKMSWGRPLFPWQQNLGKFGLFLYNIAYNSACMADTLEMFEPTTGADQGAEPCCHGNDIWARRGVQTPTGLFYCIVCVLPRWRIKIDKTYRSS